MKTTKTTIFEFTPDELKALISLYIEKEDQSLKVTSVDFDVTGDCGPLDNCPPTYSLSKVTVRTKEK